MIRRLQPGDLGAVAVFECEIAQVSFPEDPVTDTKFYEQKLRKFIDDPHSGAFVAEGPAGIAGWALVTRRENFVTKEQYGDFRSLYVVEAYRTSGVAFALMRAVLEFSEKSRFARVVGRTSYLNQPMRTLYQGYGFEAKHVVYELKLQATPGATDKGAHAPATAGGSAPPRARR